MNTKIHAYVNSSYQYNFLVSEGDMYNNRTMVFTETMEIKAAYYGVVIGRNGTEIRSVGKETANINFLCEFNFYFIFLNVFCLCAVHAFLPVKRLLDKVFNKHLSPEQCYALQSHFFFLSKKECLLRSNNYNSLLNILVFFAFWIG